MINKKIVILEGGNNEEHEVSKKSSKEIQKTLNKLKINYTILNVNPKNFKKDIIKYKNHVCFNALHGPFGEDGQIQRILKKYKIKFTHSNSKISSNCFNKIITKKIISNNKILTPKFILLKTNELDKNKITKIKKTFGKFVIKPVRSGSSFGIKIIKNNKDLKIFLANIENFKKELKNHKDIMIEEFISGKELTVSTIDFFGKIQSLAVTEIKYNNSFFDYKSKYSKGYSMHILPAKISKKNYKECMNAASVSHKALGCNAIARTDFILSSRNNKIYFLETNTQPGLTSMSLFPEQAKFMKISLENIVLGILKNTN